jgi:hypothetical protein
VFSYQCTDGNGDKKQRKLKWFRRHYVSYSTALKNVVELDGLAVNGEALFGSDFLFCGHTHMRILATHAHDSRCNCKQEFAVYITITLRRLGNWEIQKEIALPEGNRKTHEWLIWLGSIQKGWINVLAEFGVRSPLDKLIGLARVGPAAIVHSRWTKVAFSW